MRKSYVISHWFFTLLIAPFTSQAIEYIVGKNPHQIVGLLEVYPLSLLFSLLFSLPTFCIYLLVFNFLSKYKIRTSISKAVLIVISVLGVWITISIIKGSMSQDIIVAYSISSILVGLLIKLKAEKSKPEIFGKMVKDGLIIVKAKISMKRTEEGGRINGFISGYRPNHVFELPEYSGKIHTYTGDIQFDDQEIIQPGETKIVTVRFLQIPEIEKYIKVGQKWFINEGARTLGFGEILEI